MLGVDDPGVEEAVIEEPDFHSVGSKEGDQFLNQLQCGFSEWLSFQVALQSLLQRFRIGSETDIGPGMRLRSQNEPKRPNLMQSLFHQTVPGDGEVRSSLTPNEPTMTRVRVSASFPRGAPFPGGLEFKQCSLTRGQPC
jgi:hypothetical protein